MNNSYIRVNELVSCHPNDKGSRFYNFWEVFYEIPERVQAFKLIEEELSQLDDESWFFLKNEACKLCITSDTNRGWSQLFDKLNEAKGYCFLKSMGCVNIRFIPRAEKENIETPDLEGWKDESNILCEVKTIGISDQEIMARKKIKAQNVNDSITPGLKKKLENTFTKASSQLNSYPVTTNTNKFIYLIITYDDDLDYRDELNQQTRNIFNAMSLADIQLAIHNEIRNDFSL